MCSVEAEAAVGKAAIPTLKVRGCPLCVARFPSLWALGLQRREQKP